MAPAATMSESALAHAAAGGDGQAFATLYERYEGRVFNLAVRITGSHADLTILAKLSCALARARAVPLAA